MTRLSDTTGTAVVQALAAERRSAGAVTSGLALTLVVVAADEDLSAAEQAATVAAAAHPCRLLVVVRHDLAAPARLDAEVLVGGRLGPGEAVVMRMAGRLGLHAESVVLPLLAPDVPVVTWWPGEPPRRIAHDPLGVLADRRITDAARSADPVAALRTRAADYAPGDTDLSWTRLTGWRGLLAAAFDSAAAPARSAMVAAEPANPSAELLAGWLRSRLRIRLRRQESAGPGITEVAVTFRDGSTLRLSRKDGRTATLHGGRLTDRSLPLPRRDVGDLLAEELRRIDPDEPYAAALEACTGRRGLSGRPATRSHVWYDPERHPADVEPALAAALSAAPAGGR